MTRNDNWGWRARIGMFIVGNEAVPEAEWWAMTPSGVSVHAARVTARAPWAPWSSDRTGVTLADDLARGARQFAAMKLSAVVVGHSSSSIAGGKGWDDAVVAALREIMSGDVFVTTNGMDSRAAMAAMGVKQPMLVFPPWFPDHLVAAGVQYYADHGIAAAAHLRFDPGRKWRDLPTSELYPAMMHMEQEIEPLFAQIHAACPAVADGVFIAGTGFRCVGIIDALEQDLGRPVLSANQVSLWQCLRRSGVRTPTDGYGELLRR